MELHILHTNDVHSELDQYARMAAWIRSLRGDLQARGEHVLCYDLGDHIDRANLLSDATGGLLNAEVIKSVGYDGWVLGNNETLTIERAQWPELIRCANTKLYCSNLQIDEAELLRPYGDLMTFGDLTVGVFGVTVTYEKLLRTLGVAASDPVPVIWETARTLRERGADLVILLSHLGLWMDQALADAAVPVDVIIGGHSHHFLEGGQKRNHTWICQAGKQAKAFGHTILRVDTKRRLTSVESHMTYVDQRGSGDDAVHAVMARYRSLALRWLNEPIATLSCKMNHALFGESELVNLLCDQMREECDAEVAIANGGVISAAYRSGTVRRSDLSAICATPMRPVRMVVEGATIWRLLEQSLSMEVISKIGYGFGFRGHFIGRLHVSGATIYVKRVETEDGSTRECLENVMIGKAPLCLDQLYTISVCEFVALSPVFPALQGIEYTYFAATLRSVLGRALGNRDAIMRARSLRYQEVS